MKRSTKIIIVEVMKILIGLMMTVLIVEIVSDLNTNCCLFLKIINTVGGIGLWVSIGHSLDSYVKNFIHPFFGNTIENLLNED